MLSLKRENLLQNYYLEVGLWPAQQRRRIREGIVHSV